MKPMIVDPASKHLINLIMDLKTFDPTDLYGQVYVCVNNNLKAIDQIYFASHLYKGFIFWMFWDFLYPCVQEYGRAVTG